MTQKSNRRYASTHSVRPLKRTHRIRDLLLIIVALALFALLLRNRIFVIRDIQVTGNSFRSAAEIIEKSGLELGMSIFNVDQDRVNGNLSLDPYVELLDVQIQFPHTIRIAVRERVPCAIINCAGVMLLIDQDGYILERMSSAPNADLIVVSGMSATVSAQGKVIESAQAGQVKMMQLVLTALRERNLTGLISELNVENQENMYLISRTGMQIILGNEENLDQKLVWMRAVLEQLIQEGKVSGVLDVSSGKNATYANR